MFDALFGKKPAPTGAGSFRLDVELHPLRLPAHKPDYVDLEIRLAVQSSTELLTSVVIDLPKGMGFEQSALSNQREIRMGRLQPNEVKHFKVKLWGTQRTEPGLYPVRVYAISHFHDYGYVLAEVRKEVPLRVV